MCFPTKEIIVTSPFGDIINIVISKPKTDICRTLLSLDFKYINVMTNTGLSTAYRECPKCQNKYLETEINQLFNEVYEDSEDTIEAYCLRCQHPLERKNGKPDNLELTKILDRNLGQTTLTELARKIFENRPMNKRQ